MFKLFILKWKKMLATSPMKWVITNNILMLDINENNYVSVGAKSIYLSYFSGEPISIAGKIAPPLLQDLPKLTLSKYPAPPCIYLSQNDNNYIELSICVEVENNCIAISNDQDQIVINDKWYPIDIESTNYIRRLLKDNSINPDSFLNLGELIVLRSLAKEIKIIESSNINFDNPSFKSIKDNNEIPGLNANLYPYQKNGTAFLNLISEQNIGCILADEMGLGKTLQIIALLQLEKVSGRSQSLVVAPATLLENWRREISQFAPGLSIFVHAGANRPGVNEKLQGYDVILISYETMIRDEPLLSTIKWNILVLDEAQNIKNPMAQRTVSVKNLTRRVSIAVTGTPVENKLEDLWSLSDFALPKLLGSLNEFQSQYTDNNDDASQLAPIVAPIILRRRVTEVAKDLPEKIEISQPIIMTKALAEAYERLRLETIREYGKAANMVATTKLRILCTHPALIGDWSNNPLTEMPKYQRTLEIFEEIFESGDKVLLFTTYQGMVDIFLSDMKKHWPAAYFNFIDGRVPVMSRQTVIDEFFNHKGYGALFLNPKAAGAGLNITAANHVIHYNPEWNPALTEQASRRAFRRKQEKPVTIHHLYYANTVEEIIMERASFKRDLAEKAVTGHSGELDASLIAKALEISPLNTSYLEYE
ncbi:ATP-dependent helicase [Legionella longbeachae]|nr:DEAD/DEAH box helicase [Legionella longbeachae]HAT8966104.1 ATP-dependent helicase [Legionella pneumophila subsp. pneumophila]HAU1059707.1 DEAD/DEAH box helicase [Legionella pneumophila]ARB90778.1 ATP-dependent helicase [Legionella longbeachae]RZV22650.1 DEAD/DEAH box helicase [Legionella longbeachae]UAK46020.1 DEAD/DEAH box helicase [Legionella longbeachae]